MYYILIGTILRKKSIDYSIYSYFRFHICTVAISLDDLAYVKVIHLISINIYFPDTAVNMIKLNAQGLMLHISVHLIVTTFLCCIHYPSHIHLNICYLFMLHLCVYIYTYAYKYMYIHLYIYILYI